MLTSRLRFYFHYHSPSSFSIFMNVLGACIFTHPLESFGVVGAAQWIWEQSLLRLKWFKQERREAVCTCEKEKESYFFCTRCSLKRNHREFESILHNGSYGMFNVHSHYHSHILTFHLNFHSHRFAPHYIRPPLCCAENEVEQSRGFYTERHMYVKLRLCDFEHSRWKKSISKITTHGSELQTGKV